HVLAPQLDSKNRQMHAVFVGSGTAAKARGAKILKRDEARDLVVLEFGGDPLPALSLAKGDNVRQGQEIALTGFPIGMALGLYPVTHRGIISAITPMAQPVSESGHLTAMQVKRRRAGYMAYQLDAVAYPGNSGSPIYDIESAEVIGVLNSVLVKETRESMISSPSGISYAIPVKHVRELLSRLP
ncbi:MAG: trypsin-like peptidase domain-containing protein, partial [Halioglobus sp.]